MKFKAIVRMAARSWLMMAVMALLVLMFFPALISGNMAIRIIINAAVTLASLMFAYVNGAGLGENDISYGEMLEKRRNEGYAVTELDRTKCYSRARAAAAMLLGALPWAIVALVVLITGMGYVHVAPEAVPDYLFPEASAAAMRPHEVAEVVGRVSFAAFMGYYGFIDALGPGVLEYFFLPLSFVYPLTMYIGYLTGPMQHRRKLKMIEEGKRKKLRKIRADQRRKKRQQNKGPKPEV